MFQAELRKVLKSETVEKVGTCSNAKWPLVLAATALMTLGVVGCSKNSSKEVSEPVNTEVTDSISATANKLKETFETIDSLHIEQKETLNKILNKITKETDYEQIIESLDTLETDASGMLAKIIEALKTATPEQLEALGVYITAVQNNEEFKKLSSEEQANVTIRTFINRLNGDNDPTTHALENADIPWWEAN